MRSTALSTTRENCAASEARRPRRKPRTVAFALLRRAQMPYFAEVRADGKIFLARLAANIGRERRILDAAVNPRFLEGLQRRRLRMRQSRLRAAFGESPAAAASGLNQQKFHGIAPHPVTNRSYLLVLAQLAQPG